MKKATRLVFATLLVLFAVAPLQGAREGRKGAPSMDARRIRKGPIDSARKAAPAPPYYCDGPVCGGCDVPHTDPYGSCHRTPPGAAGPRDRTP